MARLAAIPLLCLCTACTLAGTSAAVPPADVASLPAADSTGEIDAETAGSDAARSRAPTIPDTLSRWEAHPIHGDTALVAALLVNAGYLPSAAAEDLSSVDSAALHGALDRLHADLGLPESELLQPAAWEALGQVSLSPRLRKALRERPMVPREELVWAQKILSLLGIDDLRINGLADDRTRAALTRFQGERGLRRTGLLDLPTYRALGEAYASNLDVIVPPVAAGSSAPALGSAPASGEAPRSGPHAGAGGEGGPPETRSDVDDVRPEEEIGRGKSPGTYALIRSFHDPGSAMSFAEEVQKQGFGAAVFVNRTATKLPYLVCLGPFANTPEAGRAGAVLQRSTGLRADILYVGAKLIPYRAGLAVESSDGSLGEDGRSGGTRGDERVAPGDTQRDSDVAEPMGPPAPEQPRESVKPPVLVKLTPEEAVPGLVVQAQRILTRLGYPTRGVDGVMGKGTRAMLRRFQADRGLPQTGVLNKTVLTELLLAYRDFEARQRGREDTRVAPTKTREPVYVEPPMPDFEVAAGDLVFAVESVECKNEHEAWVLLYRGRVELTAADASMVRVERRYGLYYDNRFAGVSDRDWWCVPSRRFCWSEVGFNGWEARAKAGDLVRVAPGELIPERHGPVPLAADAVRRACRTTK